MNIDDKGRRIIIIGAGPAGLTAAYEIAQHGLEPIVFEQRDKVGGLSRTENFQGYFFDMGGHRFYTKVEAVNQMWHTILGTDFLLRPRLSRIFYQNKFFNYPLKMLNVLLGIGIWQAILITLSFIKWQLFPYPREDTFEQWVTNRFGKRLFETFFKTYTEKVWGIPCSELKAEWAAQRIKDLSFKTALISMLKPTNSIKTLIEEFHYPRFGPGMLWQKVGQEVERQGGSVQLNTQVHKIIRKDNIIESVVISQNGSGMQTIPGSHFISSMPISEFIQKLDPAPEDVLQASRQLSYRDFLTVCLIVNRPKLFPDNWIYIHSPEVKVGRIQNFKNWSQDMVPDPDKTSLGLEYFCCEDDEIWNMPDANLIDMAKQELERIGLAKAADIENGCVFRVPKAYPIYDSSYRESLLLVRKFVESLENFQTIGRNGLHRYNNQDHSMLTGMLAARNLLFQEKNDLWLVNTDQEYQEEVRLPEKKKEQPIPSLTGEMTWVFSKIDPVALGFSTGLTSGLILLLSTLWLVLKGGDVIGPNMALLGQFFPGYMVNVPGAFIGLLYAGLLGFILGFGLAYLRNMTFLLTAIIIRREIEVNILETFFDYL